MCVLVKSSGIRRVRLQNELRWDKLEVLLHDAVRLEDIKEGDELVLEARRQEVVLAISHLFGDLIDSGRLKRQKALLGEKV